MRIVFASDHAGLPLKQELVEHARSRGIDAVDLGPAEAVSVDYPAFAVRVAAEVRDGRADRGVLVCGTGIGMSMTANRVPGIRAALCHDAFTAEACRSHNDANVLCLGARTTGPGVALQIFELFVATPFAGGRHARRVAAIDEETRHE